MHDDHDPTEITRRIEVNAIDATPVGELPQPHWTSEKLREEFDVLGFMAPYVAVRRKRDGVEGSLQFKHYPRVYFNWEPNK